MMHLILKSTSQELHYKTNRSPERVALLSTLEAAVLLFFFPLQQRRLLVSTRQPHIMSFEFQRCFLVRGELFWRNPTLSANLGTFSRRSRRVVLFSLLDPESVETPAGWSSVGEQRYSQRLDRKCSFWQQLQRRWDTLGLGRLGLAGLCPGLWRLFTAT